MGTLRDGANKMMKDKSDAAAYPRLGRGGVNVKVEMGNVGVLGAALLLTPVVRYRAGFRWYEMRWKRIGK